MYKLFIQKPTLESETQYKKYKNKPTAILRYAEKNVNEEKNDSKQIWKALNSTIKVKRSSVIPDDFISSGKNVTNVKDTLNGFNVFFVNVGLKLANKILKT